MRLIYILGATSAAELDAVLQFDDSVRRTQKFVHTFAEDVELVRLQMSQLEDWVYVMLIFGKRKRKSS